MLRPLNEINLLDGPDCGFRMKFRENIDIAERAIFDVILVSKQRNNHTSRIEI